jgi:hypothetical protein
MVKRGLREQGVKENTSSLFTLFFSLGLFAKKLAKSTKRKGEQGENTPHSLRSFSPLAS